MNNTEQNDNIDCEKIRTTAELNEELLTAIENDSLEQVKSLVEQGADVNYKDEDDDWTPLMYAVMSSYISPYNLEIIEYLIEKGADINAEDDIKHTALMWAIDSGNFKVIQLLIENGANVNAQDISGDTALKYAVDNDELNLVKLLIKHGADVNAKDKFNQTALIIACYRNNFEIAKFLIDNGANVNVIKGFLKKTPLIYACETHNDGSLELVKYLIERGADVNAKDSDGNTALKYAITYQSKEVIKFLISQSADVNAKDSDGKTPLMEAAKGGLLEIVKLLIDSGVDMNAKDNDGKTTLMYAKNVEIKNYLKRAMGKQKLSQSTLPQSTEEIEKIMTFINCDYLDLSKLKKEVEKLNLATNKIIDLSLALQKKVSDLQEDSFLNAQYINANQQQINKIQNILKKHITDTDNFIMEFAEEYDKENNHIKELKCKQKGFICKFFDRFTRKP